MLASLLFESLTHSLKQSINPFSMIPPLIQTFNDFAIVGLVSTYANDVQALFVSCKLNVADVFKALIQEILNVAHIITLRKHRC